ncbi:MAG: hypothetical protein DHS80DRAFT_25664 [Piptocephalis tieghemiana]|nr:MAG: hypothetical protein DHS80DRAFT_25664 [Piptocephalis tieghemiana]
MTQHTSLPSPQESEQPVGPYCIPSPVSSSSQCPQYHHLLLRHSPQPAYPQDESSRGHPPLPSGHAYPYAPPMNPPPPSQYTQEPAYPTYASQTPISPQAPPSHPPMLTHVHESGQEVSGQVTFIPPSPSSTSSLFPRPLCSSPSYTHDQGTMPKEKSQDNAHLSSSSYPPPLTMEVPKEKSQDLPPPQKATQAHNSIPPAFLKHSGGKFSRVEMIDAFPLNHSTPPTPQPIPYQHHHAQLTRHMAGSPNIPSTPSSATHHHHHSLLHRSHPHHQPATVQESQAARRAAQNRMAQRNFRLRKERYVRELEARSLLLDRVSERLRQRRMELRGAREEARKLRRENAQLRGEPIVEPPEDMVGEDEDLVLDLPEESSSIAARPSIPGRYRRTPSIHHGVSFSSAP